MQGSLDATQTVPCSPGKELPGKPDSACGWKARDATLHVIEDLGPLTLHVIKDPLSCM